MASNRISEKSVKMKKGGKLFIPPGLQDNQRIADQLENEYTNYLAAEAQQGTTSTTQNIQTPMPTAAGAEETQFWMEKQEKLNAAEEIWNENNGISNVQQKEENTTTEQLNRV